MDKIRNKMKKQSGFTLIEMLIVVAIIAILVAVSIPVVQSSLERTRKATDAANERAAKAAIMVAYLSEKDSDGEPFDTTATYNYDAAKGIITTKDVSAEYGKCTTHNKGHIQVSINANGELTMKWTVGGTDLHDSEVDD